MKTFGVFVLILFFSTLFCAGQEKQLQQHVVVGIDYAIPDTKNFRASEAEVKSGGSLMFNASKITQEATVIIPKADLICKIEPKDSTYEVGGITYLFVPLIKKTNSISRKFIINKHDTTTTYDYSIYIHEENKMAEGESSPKIIVDP